MDNDFKSFGRFTASDGGTATRISAACFDSRQTVTVIATEGAFAFNVSLTPAEARQLAQILLAGVEYCDSRVAPLEVAEVPA